MSSERSLAEQFTLERRRRARDYFHQAYRLQREAIAETDTVAQRRLFRTAIGRYRRSLEFFPTAEAYTFLGWTYSFLGNLQEAISACQHAISLDPDFGNPYNDIGVYLIEQGSYDQAIPYLQQAIAAKRYDLYHYAHYNLGRIWLIKGLVHEAAREFERALEYDPGYSLAQRALEQIQIRWRESMEAASDL